MNKEPKTLQEAIVYFSNPDNCREYLIARRWPNGVICPTCGSESVTAQPKYNRWQCASHHDRRQFTLKTGTIFEDSPLGLDKWLAAVWMIVNCKNGIFPCFGCYAKNRVVHGSQNQARHAERIVSKKDVRPYRSGRNFYRRQGSEHAQGRSRSQNSRHRRIGQGCRYGAA